MKPIKTIRALILISFVCLLVSCIGSEINTSENQASKVELIHDTDGFRLLVNGEKFYIKGAGLEFGNMESLKKHGGNAFRTWRVHNGKQSGKEVLDEAHKYGLMVCMGLELERERHGFDYDNEILVKQQFDAIKKDVLELKDHPALLMWGIGNELNLRYTNPKVWNAVNDIAKMIREEDPNHPTTTMLAGAAKEDIKQILERCPDLDFLSFQLYGDIVNLPQYLKESNYQGAYIVSEWGATGHWEVAKTQWDRPIEQNSHEKAMAYKERYENIIASDPMQCIGSFVFLWGQKQERTPTWYGLFLESGEETESVDVMHFLWNNVWPDNRTPRLLSLELNQQNAFNSVTLTEGQDCFAQVKATEPDNDTMHYRWIIRKEIHREHESDGGDFEKNPDIIIDFGQKVLSETIHFKAPKPGEYRLFVYVSDHKGHAATANIPFLVK